MALVNAKCTNCGGTLRVNDENETMICPYCRSAFAVEKAVSNYNFVYNTVINNDFKAGVVNIYGSEKSPEFTVESGILTAYSGEATELVIPDNVLEIGEGVFAGRRYLTRVQLPSRLRRIADAAFFGCENLESIDLPDTLESIGMLAFAHCRALRAVSLPARLRAVRWEAFHDCTGLEAVRYGGSLEDWCRLFYIGADRQKEVAFDEAVYTRYEGRGRRTLCNYGESNLYNHLFANAQQLYIGGRLVEGCVELPDEWLASLDEGEFHPYCFQAFRGYRPIERFALGKKYLRALRAARHCFVCGFSRISPWGKCLDCGVKYTRLR